MSFGNIHYAAYILIAAVAVALSFAFYVFWRRRKISLFAKRLVVFSPRRRLVKIICIFASVALFAFVALLPRWGEKSREVLSEGSDVLIALDVSRSMLARDVGTSRLDRAKTAIRWIAQSLKGDRIGLIVFAGDAFLLCPLTSDTGAFMMFLDSAGTDSIRFQGTNLGAVFNEAVRVFRKKNLSSKVFVLVTDGEDHEGAVNEAVSEFKELGVSVYTAGIGSEAGGFVPVSNEHGEVYQKDRAGKPVRTTKNASLLKQLAGYSGGAYFDISENLSGLRFVLDIIEDQQKNSYGSRIVKEPIERFAPFAVMLLALLILELMLPEIKAYKGQGETSGWKIKILHPRKRKAEGEAVR